MSTALITGASRGIGRAVAITFARRGHDVILVARNADRLASVREEVSALGRRAECLTCDVADPDAVRSAYAELDERGVTVDILVPNAGIVKRVGAVEMSDAEWRAVLAANLDGTFYFVRGALERMCARGQGRIVMVGSISSTLGTARHAAYCASKWGVVGFMKAVAEETRGTGIVVSAVLPGSVETEMLEGSGFSPQMTADDVAGVIVYAATDAPRALHGSAIEVFGDR